ncbi:MAG: hypothetical protein HC905_21215 [Bacteroidales bacterium]|nr:hypothetical protein [Bacteroidales bacterium]
MNNHLPLLLIISIADGTSGILGSITTATQIYIKYNGDVIVKHDPSDLGVNIGTINNSEKHTFLIIVDLQNRVYRISVLKSSGNLSFEGYFTVDDILLFHSPAFPTVSFRYTNYSSLQNYIIEDLFINRNDD